MQWELSVNRRWDGTPLEPRDVLEMTIAETPQGIAAQFTAHLAPTYTVPNAPVGFTQGLWDYDVVELFFARPDGSYVEIEVGPAGHWLVYEFSGYREASDKTPRPLAYRTRVEDGVWSGTFAIPSAWLRCPLQEFRVNVYQIRSTAYRREYLAWRSVPSIEPDFHRVECFESL